MIITEQDLRALREKAERNGRRDAEDGPAWELPSWTIVRVLLAENDRLANALEITEKRLRHSEFHRTSNRRTMRARGRVIVRLCGKIAKQRQALKERQGEGGKTAKRSAGHARAANLHHSLRRGPEDA